MSCFKSFKTIGFDNIKIKGLYEKGLKPVELIVNVSFSVVPTRQLEEDSEMELSKCLRQFSLFTIDKEVHKLVHEGWKYDGSRYTFNHDYLQIHFRKRTALGIDLYFIQVNPKSSIEGFYKDVSAEIAKIQPFNTSDLFIIKPKR